MPSITTTNFFVYNSTVGTTTARIILRWGNCPTSDTGAQELDANEVLVTHATFFPELLPDQEIRYNQTTVVFTVAAMVKTTEQLAAEGFRERITLLSSSDWWDGHLLRGSIFTTRQRRANDTYRKALRDLPNSANWPPAAIVWPTVPAAIEPVPHKPTFRLTEDDIVGFTSAVSITRALGNATRITRRGWVEIMSANTLRFDYDPDTREPLGLLVEAAATNLCLQSAKHNTTPWTKTRSTVTHDFALSPEAAVTASKLIPDTSAATTHFVQQTFAATSGVTYTASTWFKSAEWSSIELTLSGVIAASLTTTGNGSTGAVTNTGRIRKFRNGWYRLSMNCVATSTGNIDMRLRVSNGATSAITGVGTDGVLIWGAQFEVGPLATSHVATTTVSVTRSADVVDCTLDYDVLDPESFGVFCEATYDGGSDQSAGTRVAMSLDNATGTSAVTLYNKSGLPHGLKIVTSSTTRLDLASNGAATDQRVNAAARIFAGDIALSNTGLTVQTSAITDIPTFALVNPRLRIGRDFAGNHLNGHIREIIIYPTEKLTNAMVMALAL